MDFDRLASPGFSKTSLALQRYCRVLTRIVVREILGRAPGGLCQRRVSQPVRCAKRSRAGAAFAVGAPWQRPVRNNAPALEVSWALSSRP
jgi:hypothetical protein